MTKPWIEGRFEENVVTTTIEQAINQVDRIVTSAEAVSNNICHPSPEYAAAYQAFRAHRAALDNALVNKLAAMGRMGQAQVDQANHFTGDAIAAALAVGNLDYLIYESEWLKALLRSHRLPIELIPFYMEAYGDAIRSTLPNEAWIITDWIKQKKFTSILEGTH